MLNNSDRGYYNQKLSELKADYQSNRSEFIRQEENYRTLKLRENNYLASEEGQNMTLRNDNREKLINGVEKIDGQGKQINNISNLAYDAHANMQSANRELKDQRHLIGQAQDTV